MLLNSDQSSDNKWLFLTVYRIYLHIYLLFCKSLQINYSVVVIDRNVIDSSHPVLLDSSSWIAVAFLEFNHVISLQ